MALLLLLLLMGIGGGRCNTQKRLSRRSRSIRCLNNE